MKGEWAGGAANIAFPLGDNVFIVLCVPTDGNEAA